MRTRVSVSLGLMSCRYPTGPWPVFNKRLKHHVIPLWRVLSLSAALSAAPRSSLRGRLERLAESDRQMCYQVNLSDSSSKNSSVDCPSRPSCAVLLWLLSPCSLFPLRFPPHCIPPLSVSSFYSFHPLSCEATALVSLARDVLLSFWCFFAFDALSFFFLPLENCENCPFQQRVPLL